MWRLPAHLIACCLLSPLHVHAHAQALKCEEDRRAVPLASSVGALLAMSVSEVNALELLVMKLLDWSPYRGLV